MFSMSLRKCLAMSVGLAVLIVAIVIVRHNDEKAEFLRRIRKQKQEARKYAAQIIPRLSHEGDLVGGWKGVRGSGELGYHRVFSKTGRMCVFYGDFGHLGMYKRIDDTTLETRYGNDGTVYRWTFGFLNDELVLINQSTDWVEEYARVDPETLFGHDLD